MKKILHLLKDNKAFNALLNKQNIVVNSSNSEALLIASAFLTLKKDMLIVKSNQYEANLLYKQVSQMIDEALYFPVDESYRIESLAASGKRPCQIFRPYRPVRHRIDDLRTVTA